MAAADTDVTKMVRDNFVSYLEQFIIALCEVFPECAQMKQMKLKFKMATHAPTESLKNSNKTKLITQWDASMRPYYARCKQLDETIFSDGSSITLLESVEMDKKWAESDADTRECIWEYINELNKFAQTYSVYQGVPQNMMGKIQSMAEGIAEKVEKNEMSLSDLNFASLSQTVATEVGQQDLQQFAQNMMTDPSSMQSLFGMIGNMGGMGGMANMMGAMQGMGGGGGAGGGGGGEGEGAGAGAEEGES